MATKKGKQLNRAQLAALIDHTKLGPVVLPDQLKTLCDEAQQYGFASVCVPSNCVALAREHLQDSVVDVCAVIGFPHGAHLSSVKAFEAQKALEDGANELDMVINVAALKNHDYRTVYEDVHAVCEVAHRPPEPAQVKVILEVGLLDEEEKVAGCIVAASAGADYVKTSTGFGPSGATVEDVALMRRVVGANVGVKAAGGIRTLEDALKMIEAGANRLGASAGVAIVAALSA